LPFMRQFLFAQLISKSEATVASVASTSAQAKDDRKTEGPLGPREGGAPTTQEPRSLY
jgi:hypothetical protein